jgi:hypothetical protein
MNEVVSAIATARPDAVHGRGSAKGISDSGVVPVPFEDFLHDLRQPLSAIEALAYFMEMTSDDESVRRHSQRILAMVSRAHGILDNSSNAQTVTPTAA